MPPKRVPMSLLERIARELLISFKEMRGFVGAKPALFTPLYSLDGKAIEHYEVKYVDAHGAPLGFAVLSATEEDLPVVVLSPGGKPYSERLAALLGPIELRMIWFDAEYVAAEDARGRFLGETGERPATIDSASKRRLLLKEGGNRYPVPRPLVSQEAPRPVARKRAPLSYPQLKQAFVPRSVSASLLQAAWAAAKATNSPCTFAYTWVHTGGKTHYLQIPANTPPNNTGHSSGCGATAWMNLYGWHDVNWCQSLLDDLHLYNDPYINDLTMLLHNHLGTFAWPSSSQGFTWPGDMTKGIGFAESRLSHSCSYWYRHNWYDTDEAWVFKVAKDAAGHNRPFIVGYYQDWHYALGYGIAECTKHPGKGHNWLWIYPAWHADDTDDMWIPMGTIFGVYAVYDFAPLLQGCVGPMTASYDWSSGWTSAEFWTSAGQTNLLLLKEKDGLVHLHKMNGDGTVGAQVAAYDWSSGWTQARVFMSPNGPRLFLMKESDGTVHIQAMAADGSVGERVASYDWTSGWTISEFYAIAGATYLFLLKKSNGEVHIHRMSSDGSVGPRITAYDWSSGWTQARSFQTRGGTFLFLLKESDGTVHIHKLNTDGTVGARVATYDWSSGWTSADFYSYGEGGGRRTYLFLLKRDGGTVHVHRMSDDGTVGQQVDQRDWTDGWTTVRSFATGGALYLFLLKKGDGTVHIHRLVP